MKVSLESSTSDFSLLRVNGETNIGILVHHDSFSRKNFMLRMVSWGWD